MLTSRADVAGRRHRSLECRPRRDDAGGNTCNDTYHSESADLRLAPSPSFCLSSSSPSLLLIRALFHVSLKCRPRHADAGGNTCTDTYHSQSADFVQLVLSASLLFRPLCCLNVNWSTCHSEIATVSFTVAHVTYACHHEGVDRTAITQAVPRAQTRATLWVQTVPRLRGRCHVHKRVPP